MDRSRSLPDFDKSLPLPFPFLSSKRIDDFCCQRIACTLCFCKIQDAPCRILPRLHAPATLRLLKRLGERVEASRMNIPCLASLRIRGARRSRMPISGLQNQSKFSLLGLGAQNASQNNTKCSSLSYSS